LQPKRSLMVRILIFSAAIPLIWLFFQWYVTLPLSELQGSVSYRWKLYSEYAAFIAQKPILGWGIVNWPIQCTLHSVDNHYLFLTIARGWVGSAIFVSILGAMTLRLLLKAFRCRKSKVRGGSLAYTFLSIYIVYIVSLMTVWLSPRNSQIFFLITGWVEAFLLSKKDGFYSTSPKRLK